MNGVSVNMTISFEVKMVRMEVNKYKTTNSRYWLPFAFSEALLARYLNRPSSSKKMDIMVIEKNKIKILIGLIAALLTS